MTSHDVIVARTEGRPPALIEGSGRKARDRIEHLLRAAIDNDNTRKANGRSLGSFFAFLEDGAGRAYKTSVPSTCATIWKPPRPMACRPPPSSLEGYLLQAIDAQLDDIAREIAQMKAELQRVLTAQEQSR